MSTAFIYSDLLGSCSYGKGHPMKPLRLALTYELIEAVGLAGLPGSAILPARAATEKELSLIHTAEYINLLREAGTGIIPIDGPAHGLGAGDNPVFDGLYDWSRLSAGASVQAAELVAEGAVERAFNISGGLHHAMPARASGFCYINDAAIAIKRLVDLGARVAYVDIDAHHGDGVEYAFYETDKVLTISLHESGQWLFPGTGAVTDRGMNRYKGYAVNMPLPPETGDKEFVDAFMEIVPAALKAFSPDILVTQLGVDTFYTDPITHLGLTTNGFESMVRHFSDTGLPWVALGGGGYNMSNVARAWTLAWAIMNGTDVPEHIPKRYLEANSEFFDTDSMRDTATTRGLAGKEMHEITHDIEFLKREVLPLIKCRQ
ncbi:MAG: acetoin utilization protein AcuC [Proteobacteria bacterium]|nr:acetoin utilization protein AcuC [Pseudomonadota bacterium]